MVADKFQWVFSEPLLNACGTEAKFCRRQRIITPFRLGLALTATCASQPVETLADFQRGFNALWGTTITYKAFYNQVAKSRFADFAGIMTSRLIGAMTLKVLGFAKGRACAAIPANSLASSSFDVNGTIGSGLILHFGLMWVES